MPVTREKYEAVMALWFYRWTSGMIAQHLQISPWEVERIIDDIERRREEARRPQLEVFQITQLPESKVA